MPTNFTGRITLIFAITLAMLWAIFPGMFKGDFGHGLKPGIDMVAPFGTSLHVSGRDRAALEASIAPFREQGRWHWQQSEPSLEDVFIDLMTRTRDNFQ